ncbi:MAG: trehalose-phosphatase [Acidobacteriota bacterium]|nr:trehalose-phosphatase [Acidobacteriota bacterium]
MTPEAADQLEKFFRAVADAPTSLLLLDYDGTLAGFRLDRFKARPWSGVRKLLAGIQRQGRTRISIITGRPPQEVAALLALDAPVEVWGLHGAERLHPDGRRELEEVPPAIHAKLDELRRHLRREAFGGLFEHKSNAAVMHWRGHSPRKARLIERRTRELFEPLAQMEGLTLLKFESGLELRTGRDKGGAVRAILSEAEPGAPVCYLGDDMTDEAAFQAVNQAEGPHLSVLMSRTARETAAAVWLRPPAELRIFLARWMKSSE